MIQISGYFELCVMNANPCENGGTCYVEMEAESYSCACPDGWMGDRCQGMTLTFNQVLTFEWLTQNKHRHWTHRTTGCFDDRLLTRMTDTGFLVA